MKIRELLVDRYAVLRNLSPRSVVLFSQSIDRLRDFLEREPELSDFDDLTISRFLRWRSTTPHAGRLASAATVQKDKAHISSLWNFAARKRMAPDMQFPDLPRIKVPRKQYLFALISLLVDCRTTSHPHNLLRAANIDGRKSLVIFRVLVAKISV